MSIFKFLALLVWILYGLGVLVYAGKLYLYSHCVRWQWNNCFDNLRALVSKLASLSGHPTQVYKVQFMTTCVDLGTVLPGLKVLICNRFEVLQKALLACRMKTDLWVGHEVSTLNTSLQDIESWCSLLYVHFESEEDDIVAREDMQVVYVILQ